jgi:hypothetical protein
MTTKGMDEFMFDSPPSKQPTNTSMDNTQKEMPKYRSHKEVWALKIAAIEFHKDGSATVAPKDAGYMPFKTGPKYWDKFATNLNINEEGADLGYFVQYKDDYQSWSPTSAFEEGYARSPSSVYELRDTTNEEGYKVIGVWLDADTPRRVITESECPSHLVDDAYAVDWLEVQLWKTSIGFPTKEQRIDLWQWNLVESDDDEEVWVWEVASPMSAITNKS